MAIQLASTPSKNRLWVSLLVLWAALVAFGSTKLELFAATPGQGPAGASVAAGKRFHLYIFLHPLCPCSNATIHEVLRIQATTQAKLDVTAVIDDGGFSAETARPLLSQLSAEPGIAIEVDPDGTKTAAFGARTSGQALLYDASGKLVFSGGVTGARAHEGDNPGETAILDIVGGRTPSTRSTPAFGCALSLPRYKP